MIDLTRTLILRHSRRTDSMVLTVIPRDEQDADSRVAFHGIKSVANEIPELVERFA